MKKLFFTLVAAMMATTTVFAQGSLLATLSHEGSISAYYGIDALKSAMAAAEDGDVITLSSGQFNAATINKAVTLRGAGMSLSTDSLNRHESTLIQNGFTINLTDTLAGRLVMEGLYFKNGITYTGHIKNAQFLKCRFTNFIASTNAKMTNATFIHCRIYDGFKMEANSSAYFVNCAVGCPRSEAGTSSIEFDNCFVKFDYSSSYGCYASLVANSFYKNCIIQNTSSYSNNAIPSSCTAYNCVGIGSYSGIFSSMPSGNQTNRFVSSISTIFKTYNTTTSKTYVSDAYNFELTETAANTYLGLDGTQVGMYGGNLVYDENPTIPQITKCNVAAKSTADGKLSVDIEVKAASY